MGNKLKLSAILTSSWIPQTGDFKIYSFYNSIEKWGTALIFGSNIKFDIWLWFLYLWQGFFFKFRKEGRVSSTKGCLPPKVIFHQRLSSIKGPLPPKVVFHQMSSSIKGHLPSKVVFHKRLSYINDRLP